MCTHTHTHTYTYTHTHTHTHTHYTYSHNEILFIIITVEDPPIGDIVESGVIPLFVQFLGRDHQCTLQVISSYIVHILI